jgi:hypothetical protein
LQNLIDDLSVNKLGKNIVDNLDKQSYYEVLGQTMMNEELDK